MTIRNIVKEDIEELVKLHKTIFSKDHFSSIFPPVLLKEYFSELLQHHEYTYVAIENEKIVGYLIAGMRPEIPVNRFLKKKILRIFFILIANPKFLIEKIRELILKYSKSKNKTYESSISVYLIAVRPDKQKKGIGKILLQYLENLLIQNNIDHYTLSVRAVNLSSVEFYLKNKFEVVNRNFRTISFKKVLQ